MSRFVIDGVAFEAKSAREAAQIAARAWHAPGAQELTLTLLVRNDRGRSERITVTIDARSPFTVSENAP